MTKMTKISAERIEALKAHGYKVENIQEEYGWQFYGQYRWIKDNGDFQDHEPSYSPEAAWAAADTWETGKCC